MTGVDDVVDRFQRDGFVLVPGVVSAPELEALRADAASIIEGGPHGHEHRTDYMVDRPGAPDEVFHRVQYVFPKAPRRSFLTLLAHPRLLDLTQRLLGPSFVCLAEALVFKQPGDGRPVRVHADCDPADPRLSPLIFNVDIYLDDADERNGCLLAVPGSHRLGLRAADIAEAGFGFPGLVPVPARAGDVIVHDVRVVHGSQGNHGPTLRRTLYYEMHSLSALLVQGGPRPGFAMTDQFVTDRVRLLMRALDQRARSPYAANEAAFPLTPPPEWPVAWPAPDEPVELRPALGHNAYF